MTRTGAALLLPVLLLLGLFFLIPILFIVMASVLGDGGAADFSLAMYVKIISEAYYLRVFFNTFLFSVAVTALVVVLGYPLATLISRTGAPERNLLIFLVIAPLLISMVVKAYGWQLLLGNQGMINSAIRALGLPALPLLYNWTGVVIATVHVLLPFAVISIAGVLSNLDRSAEESAAVLGASPPKVFFLVTIPLAINGLITAATFVFLLALGSFVTLLMLGGGNTMVVPLLVYQQLTVVHDQSFASAMATILMAVTLAMLFAQFRFLRSRAP